VTWIEYECFLTDVFLLVAGGVFVGLFILVIEIIFKRYKERLEKKNQISRTALIHWKQKVEVRKKYILLCFFLLNFISRNVNNKMQ